MSENRRSTSPSAAQVENWRKKINIEQKSDVISGLENGRGIVDVFRNARLALISLGRIRDNDDGIKESAKFNIHGSVHRNNILGHNSNQMHKSQSLFNLTTAVHVSGVTITHLQEHKTTVY